MTRTSEEEKSRWDQVLENFDVLFTQIADIKQVQEQMKTQMDLTGAAMDQYTQDQQFISKQVKANGAAVAELTLKQFDRQPKYDEDERNPIEFDEKGSFHNVFSKNKDNLKPEPSRNNKLQQPRGARLEALNHLRPASAAHGEDLLDNRLLGRRDGNMYEQSLVGIGVLGSR